MRIVCKSSVNKDELAYKSTLGFDGVELQLFSWGDEVNLEYMKNIGLNLVNIHTPLGGHGATLLENLVDDMELGRLYTFLDNLSYENTDGLNLVLHSEKLLTDDLLIKISNTLDRLHNKYGVKFSVENSPLIKTMGEGIGLNKFYKPKDVPTNVHNLKSMCSNKDVVHSLLDVTHAVSSTRIANNLNYGKNYCLEDYFKVYGETMNICHLANCKEYGVGKPYHGVGFQDDEDILLHYLSLIRKYCIHLEYLVIEMVEDNYQKCDNMLHCKNILDDNNLI